MSTLTETAPTDIYLCVSDDAYMLDEEFPTWGVTWADNPAQTVTVHYVRADLVKKSEIESYQQSISRLKSALLDIIDGALETPEEIHAATGLPIKRCKEIIQLTWIGGRND
jgi:hypothetical protein